MAVTYLANLVNPSVMADIVDSKLTDNIVFSGVATINNDLEGRPGSVLLFPSYQYIGDAQTLAEGSTVSVTTLLASTVSVTIKKIAKGVEITDEAALSGYGDPLGEAASQIAVSLAAGVDNEILTKLQGISSNMTYYTTGTSVLPKDTDIIDALEKFGEDIDGVKVVFVTPAVYTAMRKNVNSWIPASEVAANIAVKGIVGEYQGCQVVVTNKLKTSGDSYIIKPGALNIILKRGAMIESDRDIEAFTTVITGSIHFAAYVYDESKVVRLTKKAS